MCIYHILRKLSFSDFLVAFLEHSGTANQSMTCKAPKEKLLLFHENNMKKISRENKLLEALEQTFFLTVESSQVEGCSFCSSGNEAMFP